MLAPITHTVYKNFLKCALKSYNT